MTTAITTSSRGSRFYGTDAPNRSVASISAEIRGQLVELAFGDPLLGASPLSRQASHTWHSVILRQAKNASTPEPLAAAQSMGRVFVAGR